MEEIYKKIKQLRFESGMTLKELSEKTDLSVSFLSQIERGASTLAITSLKRIAEAFGVKMIHFFEEPENVNYAVRKEDQKPFKIETSESTYVRLSSNFTDRKIEPLIITMMPQQKDKEFVRHPGEEFYFVLKGAVLIRVDQNDYYLREGEAIHFPSTQLHMWENPLDQETVILSVVTPVIF
ncbi:XRE family transcriptional regulator [Cytobacillus oceanisediminis]|jgi:transcriptional regulator with XRE-family HTH domain|uniref:XRE family transcriptional regulator n=1 Tax=Cytobacillus oceanisediminis TaxID=665099 RepID=A0A2V3A655_9BACI|nr:XRE family transcriptional regulator [Cytobacillus oceanisediminis]PWW32256.1 XRE family transcriptional regulator [Cytobacillus oceanisediminis]